MWSFKHAVRCTVSRASAWQFWTNVENWAAVDSSVEAVSLDGPFAAGTRGTTKPRGLEPVSWQITDVEENVRAVIEVQAPGAVFTTRWTFEDAPGGGSFLTQEASIVGEQAGQYAPMGKEMEIGIPQGMAKLAAAMAEREGRT